MGPDQSTVHDRVVSADATSTRIPDLNAFTSYTFKVSAKTKAGSGPAASILSKTPEGGETYLSLYICITIESFWHTYDFISIVEYPSQRRC